MATARPLDIDEREKVKEAFAGRHRYRNQTIWELNQVLGLRITELLKLRLQDVVDPDGYIRDVIQIRAKTTKTKKATKRWVTPTLRKMLHEWVNHLYENGYRLKRGPLFPKNRNDPITRHATYSAIRRAKRKAGLRGTVSNHSTRKNFAVDILKEAMKLEKEGKIPSAVLVAMKIGGWSSLDAFLHYIGNTDEAEQQIIEAICKNLERNT